MTEEATDTGKTGGRAVSTTPGVTRGGAREEAWLGHHPGTQHCYVSVSGYQKLTEYTAPQLGPELYTSQS